MIGSPYLQLLWTYVPKTVLMLLVLAILLALVLKRRPQQLGKARPLALSAIGLLLANTLAVPVTYAWLVQAASTHGASAMWLQYAIAGGLFTLLEVIALLLLGLAVLAGRPPR